MHVDLANQLMGAPSQLPGSTALSGTTAANGSGVDCDLADGPIYGLFNTGAPTGSPTSFTVTCKLQESDASGSGFADIANQSTLVLSAGSTQGVIRAHRTKRYVRTVVTPAFSGGSSPTIPTSANVIGQKRRIGT